MFHTVFCRSERTPAGQDVANWVMDAIASLRTRGFFRARPDLVACMRETKQVLLIEFDELLASDDVWELLDVVEARTCRELDGVAYAEDEVS